MKYILGHNLNDLPMNTIHRYHFKIIINPFILPNVKPKTTLNYQSIDHIQFDENQIDLKKIDFQKKMRQ